MAEPIKKTQSNQVAVKSKQSEMVQLYLGELMSSCSSESSPLTAEQKDYSVPILHSFCKSMAESKYSPQSVNTVDFLEQVKYCSKLGLSIQNKEIYLSFRNNSKTNMIDCTITKQYQGIQKEMIAFSSKPIVKFLHGVICSGDIFESETNFLDGSVVITKHKKGDCPNRHDLKNITGAYAIAYCKENDTLVPYMAILEKQRITRAYGAAQTKNVWISDTQSMVIKTAYWVLYNNVLKPYINVPIGSIDAWEKTNDKMVWDNPSVTNEVDNDIIYDIDVDVDSDVEIVDNHSSAEEKSLSGEFIMVQNSNGKEVRYDLDSDDCAVIDYFDEYKPNSGQFEKVEYPNGDKAYQVDGNIKTMRVRKIN